ncbi:hypothetical protein E4V01_01935 [Methylorubrum sp. Q1]|nr:hypothetical protein E4V01_01935 [Methylorubrum sp. Q1]
MPPLPPREALRIPHLSPARRRVCVEHIVQTMKVSERRACRALGQTGAPWRWMPHDLPLWAGGVPTTCDRRRSGIRRG